MESQDSFKASQDYIQLCAEYANPKYLLTKVCLKFKQFMPGMTNSLNTRSPGHVTILLSFLSAHYFKS